MDRARRALAGIFLFSSRVGTFLQVGQLQLAEELDLVLQADAELLERAPARLGHERERIRGRGAVRVLDEVRVLRRDLRSAAAIAPEAARLEHPARAQLVLGVLEDAAEGAPVRRLGFLPARVQLAHLGLDLLRRSWPETELRANHDLPVSELRVPIAQPELRRIQPAAALGRRDERSLEQPGEVAAVSAGVHPDTPADRAGNRAGELEAAEPGRAGAMQRDGVRRAAAHPQHVAVDLD